MSKLFESFLNKEKIISVTGLGYVGLPLVLVCQQT
jgi:UDP-N-acetyl-D-mannosaminuronate dehydrogenase